jgi:hypothetical protein
VGERVRARRGWKGRAGREGGREGGWEGGRDGGREGRRWVGREGGREVVEMFEVKGKTQGVEVGDE